MKSPPVQAAPLQPVALVTGASRGIGFSIAEILRSRGITVITPTRAEMDLSDSAKVLAWLEGSRPTIDILINNAGENPVGPFTELALETWQRVVSTNLTAPMLLMQHLGRSMGSRHWGRILNISSCYSRVARTGRAPYGATKAALNSLTRSVALELAGQGVLVNSLLPGFVETDLTRRNNTAEQIRGLASQIPLGRLADPGEIARFAAFLASPENTYITGQSLVIDGGFLIQ